MQQEFTQNHAKHKMTYMKVHQTKLIRIFSNEPKEMQKDPTFVEFQTDQRNEMRIFLSHLDSPWHIHAQVCDHAPH